VKTSQTVRDLIRTLKFEGIPPTIKVLSRRMGKSYGATLSAAKKERVAYVSEADIFRLAYKAAAIICASRDPHGIATYRDIARERKVHFDAVRRYFRKNNDLKKEFNVFDKFEEREVRCRISAARLRQKDPRKPLFRKVLAYDMRWTPERLNKLLAAKPMLLAELGIEDSRTVMQADCVEFNKNKYRDAEKRFRDKNPDRPMYRIDLAKELNCKLSTLNNYLADHPEMIDEMEIKTIDQGMRAKIVVRKNIERYRVAAKTFLIRFPERAIERRDLARILKCSIRCVYLFLAKHPRLVKQLNIADTDRKDIGARRTKKHLKRYRAAAATFRRENPGAKLTVGALAKVLKTSYAAVHRYVTKHQPSMASKLSIELRSRS
jgi:hypothetical protein